MATDMSFDDALAGRRSCRSYSVDPVESEVLESVLAAASRGPSAGNTWALDLVVLEGPTQTARYWETTLPSVKRDQFPWPGLLRAPVLVVPVVDPTAYVRRYAEPDKAHAGLGNHESDWTVPYWWVDGGAAVMAILLAASAAGLGSLFFGVFDHEVAVAEVLGIPPDRRLLGTVALGYPDGADRRSSSGRRRRPDPGEFIHHDGW